MPLRRTMSLLAGLLVTLCLCGREVCSQELPGGKAPDGKLSLYNTHTFERLDVAFRDDNGDLDPTALAAINRFLRCHFTNEVVPIDVRVIELLDAIDDTLGGNRCIHIVSGYRSRGYNDRLRLVSKARGVASRSLHLSGMAIDFRIPGIDSKGIHQVALDLRRGGVGYYSGSDFVHIDCGRPRSW